MNEPAREERPLISVLMAVYAPRTDWLRRQLETLEAQTWPNVRLYICCDASPAEEFAAVEALAGECIRSFPYTVENAPEHLGSNGVFEYLTSRAEGEYFAYCDQDDEWLPEKLAALREAMERERALLACSDMTIIDGEGNEIAESITEIRRHHVFRSGDGLWDTLWYKNFASGCALLVRADEARRALPFNPWMYYDHYLAFCCAVRGRVISLPDKLLRHREHGGNQSTLLRGVADRESYYRLRVEEKRQAVAWLAERFTEPPELAALLSEGREWMDARSAYARGDRSAGKTVWRFRRFGRPAAMLELLLPYLPESALRLTLSLARNNRI